MPVSYSLYGQTFVQSAALLIANSAWLFYFILHKYPVPEKCLIAIFGCSALIILAYQSIQQITYPTAFFGLMNDDRQFFNETTDDVSTRNGILRFLTPDNTFFAAVILFYCLEFYLKKVRIKYLAIGLLMIVSIYLSLTRQILVSSFFTIILGILLLRKNKKFTPFLYLIFASIIILISSYSEQLFTSLISQTMIEADSSNIRLISLAFYWDKIFDSAGAFLFGHGIAHSDSAFGGQTFNWASNGFHTSDIGIVGCWFEFGIIYLIFALILVPAVLIKYRCCIPSYVKLFVCFSYAISFFIFPMQSPLFYFLWSSLFYICDKHINASNFTSDYPNKVVHNGKVYIYKVE